MIFGIVTCRSLDSSEVGLERLEELTHTVGVDGLRKRFILTALGGILHFSLSAEKRVRENAGNLNTKKEQRLRFLKLVFER